MAEYNGQNGESAWRDACAHGAENYQGTVKSKIHGDWDVYVYGGDVCIRVGDQPENYRCGSGRTMLAKKQWHEAHELIRQGLIRNRCARASAQGVPR